MGLDQLDHAWNMKAVDSNFCSIFVHKENEKPLMYMNPQSAWISPLLVKWKTRAAGLIAQEHISCLLHDVNWGCPRLTFNPKLDLRHGGHLIPSFSKNLCLRLIWIVIIFWFWRLMLWIWIVYYCFFSFLVQPFFFSWSMVHFKMVKTKTKWCQGHL